jgi:hypothetical protein
MLQRNLLPPFVSDGSRKARRGTGDRIAPEPVGVQNFENSPFQSSTSENNTTSGK